MTPTLAGRAVLVRPLERGDAATLARHLEDVEVRRALQLGARLDVAEEQAFIGGLSHRPGDRLFGIALLDGGRLLGVCGLHGIASDAGAAQFGIFIGESADRGNGYGTEATRLAIGYGFEVLGLRRIWLQVEPQNRRALAAYERVGFRRVGPATGTASVDAAAREVVSMALLREEWRERRGRE